MRTMESAVIDDIAIEQGSAQPCPFCGDGDHLSVGTRHGMASVACELCGAAGPDVNVSGVGPGVSPEALAIQAWDARHRDWSISR